MANVNVVIVAGGRGERMKSMIDEHQKCMIPVGGKPIMAWVLDAIQDALSPEKIVIATEFFDK